jgi:type VI secretion system protein ImpA
VLIDEEIRLAILAPFEGSAGDGSVGVDGRLDEDRAGDLLRELRSQRKALVRLEQAAAMGDDEVAIPDGAWDWDAIGENAVEYLTTHGKDLEAMALLVEAAARGDGLDDLAVALECLADLVEAFWDEGLYPAEDEDDGVAARFQPLSGLSGGSQDRDGALILPLRRVRITRSGLRMLDKVRGESLMASAQVLKDSAKTDRIDEAQAAFDTVAAAVRQTPPSALAAAAATAARMDAAWRRAIAHISERTRPQFPAASRLNEELRTLADWLTSLAPTAVAPDEVPMAEEPDGAPVSTGGGQGGFQAGRITRRDDALKAIVAAADYFLQFEPQSPLGTTLREVDRRARMSLDDLLSELIPDESSRKEFYWRSGIKPPEEPESDDD